MKLSAIYPHCSKSNSYIYPLTKRYVFLRVSYVCFILICALIFLPGQIYAQSTMTGGSYTLNGGVTVFSSEGITGGGFNLVPASDPVVGNGSGDTFVLTPTPYYTTLNSGSSYTAGSVNGNVSSGAGYTYINNSPIFYPIKNSDSSNIEWIDDGSGVDLNQDGIPDIFAPYSQQIEGQGVAMVSDKGKHEDSHSETYHNRDEVSVKKYSNSLSEIQIILIIMYALLFMIVPVVRGPFPYKISRFVPAIIIDWIIALHKDISLKNIPYYSKALEGDELKNGQHMHYFTLFLLDTLAIPIILVIGAVYIWGQSSVLSLILLGLLAIRLYIGELLTRGHK